jgi:DNA invertase Pin-like site-specific DNA recombinase
MDKTAVIYCRVSDPSLQDTAGELDQQEQECRKCAAANGITVLRTYREAHTGSEDIGRVKLWEAVDDIKYGRASIILMDRYDRLSRGGVASTFAIQHEVEQYGGSLLSATEKLPDGEMGQAFQAFYAAMAKIDKDKIVSKFARGKRYRAAQGRLMAAPHPMYGYAWADDVPGKRTRYEVDEESAAVVRRVFALAAQGWSLRKIARQLNEEHTLTPSAYAARNGRGGRSIIAPLWTLETVRHMVREKAYTGQAAAFRYVKTLEYVKDKQTGIVGLRKTKALRAEDDTEIVPLPETTWPALVDVATFNAILERLGRDGANTREGLRNLKNKEAYLLRGGHVICGVCEANMTGAKRTDGGGYYYRCPRRRGNMSAPDEGCVSKGQTVNTRLIDTAAWDAARYALEHTDNLRAALDARLEGGAVQDQTARHLRNLEGALSDKQAERERRKKQMALTEDEDTIRMWMREVDNLSAEIRDLEKERAEARAVVASHEERRAWAERIMGRIIELTLAARKDWYDTGEREVVEDKLQQLGTKTVDRFMNPAPPALDALNYEERRQALYLLGLRVRVYPPDHEYTRANGKRWEIVMDLAGASGGDNETGTYSGGARRR